jgi:hypothetical protein
MAGTCQATTARLGVVLRHPLLRRTVDHPGVLRRDPLENDTNDVAFGQPEGG